jgi:tetraacyldisaccharide 4'-kinase
MELARGGLRVFVGAERLAAGRLAEADGGRGVHVLDDGFQHRRLGRELDVVLLTLEEVGDWLLPAGNRREPLRALGRADVVVVREEELVALRKFVEGKTVWVIRRVLEVTMPARAVAFCGIARPEGFFSMLPGLAGRVAFADHQRYGEAEVARLVEVARSVGAGGFVTTAKDEVKLSTRLRGRLEEVGPVAVGRLRVELVAGDLGVLDGVVVRGKRTGND